MQGLTFNSTTNETISKLLRQSTRVLMTPIVSFIAVLITPQLHTHTHTQPPRTHAETHARSLRDTRLLFLVKEMALLRWLFYLRPWLPRGAPDHAVAEPRRRAAGLIGAWDAQGGAAGLGGRGGKPLMGLPVCGSPLLVASLCISRTRVRGSHWSAPYSSGVSSNHRRKTTARFVREQMGNRFFLF